MAKNRKLTFLNYWSHKMKLFEIRLLFFLMGTRIFKANYRSSLEGGSDRRGSGVVIGFGSDDGTRGSR